MYQRGKISYILSQAVFVLALAGAASAAFYYFHKEPCEVPIAYRISTFDTQFGLSRTDFLEAINQASDIWEKAIGRDLFTYDPKGKLQINLVYDERQQETKDRQQIGVAIDQTESLYKTKRAEFDALTAQYKTATAEYESLATDFRAKADAYEADVSAYNGRGGGSKSEYNRLTQEKNELLALQATLEPKRLAVNALADRLRILTAEVNALAGETNAKIDSYNSGQFVGKEFDAGLYIRDAKGERITIYQFDSKAKLIRVLAHELGHALGLEHNDNLISIMYALNQSEREKLSSDDLVALKTLCGIQ
ncbi:MAG: hypothetical protein A3C06_04125 [Candidatus Taylorbacteria bacterium RIFCSPHIGHO2_02_FULL_46_13]|uniref:Peptidase M10 metallopeptidase domain-containing protein n=1 Tax=Candidatus Taylorbacteria bacterium RIFCSPHIGHO2_02_FULL_46_13 TaxID=1802312 RepID=A0A1G2MWC1_9BACT|nr:MAG: hypothetical protein A3C06_04125 [Candidatus Taylorbacteria bacterium RIFCSPHIGHO2_02_FULL_46_13]